MNELKSILTFLSSFKGAKLDDEITRITIKNIIENDKRYETEIDGEMCSFETLFVYLDLLVVTDSLHHEHALRENGEEVGDEYRGYFDIGENRIGFQYESYGDSDHNDILVVSVERGEENGDYLDMIVCITNGNPTIDVSFDYYADFYEDINKLASAGLKTI